jgi:hypothetical protein
MTDRYTHVSTCLVKCVAHCWADLRTSITCCPRATEFMRGRARVGITATCSCVCYSCQPCRQCCPLCCGTQERLQRVQERGVCDVACMAEGLHIGHERWGAGAQAGCQGFTGRLRVEENVWPILHSMQLGTDNHSRFTPWRELMDTSSNASLSPHHVNA